MYFRISSIFICSLLILGLGSQCMSQGISMDTLSSDFGPRIKVEDKNACGFDLFASNNNSTGGIKKVGSFDYFDPNGGSAFNQDEVRISNTASTSGKIKLNTLRTNTAINTMEFRGGNNGNIVALQITHSNMLPLQLRANGNMTIGGTLTQNSDLRLKKNLEALSSVLPRLSEISAYRYNWNNEMKGNQKQIGVIAQDVQNVYPELVSVSEDGTLSVAYGNLTAILLEATKELHELYEEQEQKIEELEKRLEEK